MQAEATLLQAIMNILTVEDARVGLKQSSVGQWPKLVSGNLLSTPRTGEKNHEYSCHVFLPMIYER